MTLEPDLALVAQTPELRCLLSIPDGPDALTVVHHAIAITPARAKALATRWLALDGDEYCAAHEAARDAAEAAGHADAWEVLHREAWAHTHAAMLRHQAHEPDEDLERWTELWSPTWQLLTTTVPAAACGLLTQRSITGHELLQLAGPWIELYGR